MTRIYTDASVSSEMAAVSHIVLDESRFIGYNYLIIHNVYKSHIGELIGIREGLKYYKSLHREPTEVTVFTDSDKAIEILSRDVDTVLGVSQKLCREIHDLCKECNATVESYVGHQHVQNPNQIADNVAKSALRGVLKRGEVYETTKI